MSSQTGEETALVPANNEQFIVVRKSRRKNGRLRISYERGEKIKKIVCSQHPVYQVSMERIDTVMKNACNNTELIKYSQQIIALLLKSLSGRQLSSIWALGLGSFNCSYYPGCDQLAVLLELKHFFGCEVYFQEPCLTKMEKHWLCNHAIRLSETKDLLECRVSDDGNDNENVVLFYAPHCGHAVYNSVIYAHRKKLRRIIIAEINAEEYAVKQCNLNDLENSDFNELQALLLYSKACTLLEFPTFKSNFAAFNDTALHFLLQNAPLLEISEARPMYRLFRHEIMI
ncbi:Gliomedin [Dirofilaria immitis]